jgi:hypothetical protein
MKEKKALHLTDAIHLHITLHYQKKINTKIKLIYTQMRANVLENYISLLIFFCFASKAYLLYCFI